VKVLVTLLSGRRVVLLTLTALSSIESIRRTCPTDRGGPGSTPGSEGRSDKHGSDELLCVGTMTADVVVAPTDMLAATRTSVCCPAYTTPAQDWLNSVRPTMGVVGWCA
jgi:hypothetical protein